MDLISSLANNKSDTRRNFLESFLTRYRKHSLSNFRVISLTALALRAKSCKYVVTIVSIRSTVSGSGGLDQGKITHLDNHITIRSLRIHTSCLRCHHASDLHQPCLQSNIKRQLTNGTPLASIIQYRRLEGQQVRKYRPS